MLTIERGDTRILTWAGSADPDLIFFAVFSGESVVATHAAVQSGTGAYYSVVPFPSGSYSPGYYNGRWETWASSLMYTYDELVRIVDVTALDAGSYYANVADVRDAWSSLNAAGASVVNASIDNALRKAHTVIDGFLIKSYTLPFDGTPPLLRTLATDLALYRIASRQVPRDDRGNLPAWIQELKEDVIEILASVNSANMDLVTASGTTWPRALSGGEELTHSYDGKAFTFTHLDVDDQRVDPEILDEEADEVW